MGFSASVLGLEVLGLGPRVFGFRFGGFGFGAWVLWVLGSGRGLPASGLKECRVESTVL